MKKVLLFVMLILVIAAGGLFLFQNDLQVWNVTNKYKEDPSSIRHYDDIPEEINEAARNAILNAYLETSSMSEPNMDATVDLIEFLHGRDAKASRNPNYPVDMTAFRVLMDIYEKTTDKLTRSDIAGFLKREDEEAFYKYYNRTQRKELPFYDLHGSRPKEFPDLEDAASPKSKALWCKHVEPKLKKICLDLLMADTLSMTKSYFSYARQYEETNCSGDVLALRKIHFERWVDFLVEKEKSFPATDGATIRNEMMLSSLQRTNEMETTSLISLVDLDGLSVSEPVDKAAKEKLLLYILDYPLKSRMLCLKINFYCCNLYIKNKIGMELIEKVKQWQKVVDEKYPALDIYGAWEQQLAFNDYLNS